MDTERRIMELAESTLRLEKNEGENKVISLREAIKRMIEYMPSLTPPPSYSSNTILPLP
jgi:hypothetical protein